MNEVHDLFQNAAHACRTPDAPTTAPVSRMPFLVYHAAVAHRSRVFSAAMARSTGSVRRPWGTRRDQR